MKGSLSYNLFVVSGSRPAPVVKLIAHKPGQGLEELVDSIREMLLQGQSDKRQAASAFFI
tara:strand:+ start:624 stop:803 length:180 start_codon:yes stop_codon:yes gene_type:complete